MVWTAVGFGLFAAAVIAGCLREWHWQDERAKLAESWNFAEQLSSQTKSDLAETRAALAATELLLSDARDAAAVTLQRYDALVDKMAAKAAKPDDGIIHAKNSGDVRRIFEQQVTAQMMEAERKEAN